MTVLDRIHEYARADVPAATAASNIGLTYPQMAALIRQHGLHSTYTGIRKAEQQRALSRIFATTGSQPPVPPIPARQNRRKRKAPPMNLVQDFASIGIDIQLREREVTELLAGYHAGAIASEQRLKEEALTALEKVTTDLATYADHGA